MNWFLELKKWTVSSLINKKEDFISIVFAGVIESNQDFKVNILKQLFNNSNINNPNILVQEPLYNDRVDIYIEDLESNFVGVIECKVDDEPRKEQLERYMEKIRIKYPQEKIYKEVILITQFPHPFIDNEFKVFTWNEIYNTIKNDSSEGKPEYLIKEYKKLLKEYDLILTSYKLEHFQNLHPKSIPPELYNKRDTTLIMIQRKLIELNLIRKETCRINGNTDWRSIYVTSLNNQIFELIILFGCNYPKREDIHLIIRNPNNHSSGNWIGGINYVENYPIEERNTFWKFENYDTQFDLILNFFENYLKNIK